MKNVALTCQLSTLSNDNKTGILSQKKLWALSGTDPPSAGRRVAREGQMRWTLAVLYPNPKCFSMPHTTV